MNDVKLSPNLENYLEVIADLSEEHGHAHVKEVAIALNVKAPSVTNALQSLVKKGLVNYKAYSTITLTKEGKIISDRMSDKHSTLREFLINILAMKRYSADKYACKLEHLVDDKVADRIERMNEFIKENSELADSFLVPLNNYLNGK